ncbi:MAG: hypothetical protein KAX10_00560 [Candidatus Lokiarchaeota archaeon]|nr:hypothetical protein [Candidatus Lokiarchaeota archaeon]
MHENVEIIKSIIRLKDYIENEEDFKHLFEIQLAPPGLKNFRPRFNFDKGGTLLVGDLVLNIEEEQYLESHPFPEWVVQLISKEGPIGSAYLIVPNLPNRFISRLNTMNYEKRIAKIDEVIKNLTTDDLIAFEYQIGVSIKVNANVPHTFISKIDLKKNEKPPYLQVYEPNLRIFNEVLKFKTPYYKLPFKIKI